MYENFNAEESYEHIRQMRIKVIAVKGHSEEGIRSVETLRDNDLLYEKNYNTNQQEIN